MIIIAFSTHTSKLIPNIFCRDLRHVAVIVPDHRPDCELVMHQFIRRGRVVKIPLRHRDLRILGANGWRFIYLDGQIGGSTGSRRAITCVGYAKKQIGIRDIRIQTPRALYRQLIK